MTSLSRRLFVQRLLASGSALALPGWVAGCASAPATGKTAGASSAGLGPLRPHPAAKTAEALLELPVGFEYSVFGRAGSPLSDGAVTPGLHGGIGVFDIRKTIKLIRNHGAVGVSQSPGADFMHAYDPVGGGCTTTLEIDPVTREVKRQYISLGGTSNNSGGGATPWKSWIACEATTRGVSTGFTQPHGYCFEVRADVSGGIIPVPLKGMGRFVHASACVDPETQSVFLTEHAQPAAGFYRFAPRRQKSLAAGGKLQMLAIAQQPNYDARGEQDTTAALPVIWVDIAEADPADAENNPDAVNAQGFARGGARFGRLGGVAYDDGAIFFTALDGEDSIVRQVWSYRIRASRYRTAIPADTVGTLRLVHQRREQSNVRVPSELCATPWGGLLLSERAAAGSALRLLTRDGRLFDFARTVVRAEENTRFAGAAFTPDGKTLFVNQQVPARTFAIWGPWQNAPL
jgi:hypothetical protein